MARRVHEDDLVEMAEESAMAKRAEAINTASAIARLEKWRQNNLGLLTDSENRDIKVVVANLRRRAS